MVFGLGFGWELQTHWASLTVFDSGFVMGLLTGSVNCSGLLMEFLMVLPKHLVNLMA